MNETDPFAHHDAAYLLGVLDDADRQAFEAHLERCADCRARVAELRGTADLLAALPRTPEIDRAADTLVTEPAPDTLLPTLLRRARRERARRRLVAGAVGAVAAACIAAAALVFWPGDSGPAHRPPALALTEVRPNPLTVTARLTPRGWGTQIDLHCTYPASDRYRFAYNLVVIDRRNEAHEAGDWTLVRGKQGIDFTSGTSVPTDRIARVQVRTPSGITLLELKR